MHIRPCWMLLCFPPKHLTCRRRGYLKFVSFCEDIMSESGYNNEEQFLVDKIHDEIRQIRQSKMTLENNCYLMDVNSPIDKAIIENNSFRLILDDNLLTDCSVSKLNPVEDLQKDLKNELESIHRNLGKLVKKIEDFKETSARLEKNSENFQLMLEAGINNQMPSRKLDILDRNIKRRFMKEKKDLKTVIGTLFPDNLEVHDLIAQISEHYFTEGADKYFKLEKTDNISDQIELLIRTELFELNPYNSLEIKFADIV